MKNKSVLLDTSFLISLVDDTRKCHKQAVNFYKYFLENKIDMYLSTIVCSEFGIKQDITELPIETFRILPFNLPESCNNVGVFDSYFKGTENIDRVSIKDDYKLTCQAIYYNLTYFITEDSPLCGKLQSLLQCGIIKTQSIFSPNGHEQFFNLSKDLFDSPY